LLNKGEEKMYLSEESLRKWSPVLDHPDLPQIQDAHRRSVTATILENTENALREAQAQAGGQSLLGEAAPTNAMGASSSTAGAGSFDIFDPVLISLVRRSMPNLMAYDICGVQPMTGPTGLIFSMRSRYSNTDLGAEAFYNEANTGHAATGGGTGPSQGQDGEGQVHVGTNLANTLNASSNTYGWRAAMETAQAEGLEPNQMAFTIDKLTVTAKTRALQAEYSMELAQDLKAVHGLDAETELSNILSTEILAEINREVVRTVLTTAVQGATAGTTAAGVFDLDTDSNGRWSVEKFKGLMFQVEREANAIAKATRRGKGNIIICSSDVASALQMAGVLDYAPALNGNNLNVDDTGNTFVGVLNGRFRVYIDPYAGTQNFLVVGYKGSNAFDAGLFYCPYVPLQMVRAVDPATYQPKIAFKTRYGMVANPFAEGAAYDDSNIGRLAEDTNVYYRRVLVNNLM
jgi:hypothetical protein